MKKTIKIIGRFLKYGTLLSTLALIGTVLLQIFARFFLASAPSWTEEASRFFFIYAIAFASGLALKKKYYVHLDVFFDRLANIWQKRLLVLIPASTFLLFGILSVFAIEFTLMGHRESSPSLGIPMSVAFCSILLMGLAMSFFAGIDTFKAIKKLRK